MNTQAKACVRRSLDATLPINHSPLQSVVVPVLSIVLLTTKFLMRVWAAVQYL
ncbi:hypothetical protein [Nostoc sp.]|uniref:hypothetical protein n=1 Tax=Nostoc sp. TaxID=1180 RepID=UPI002FFD2E72